MLSSLPAAGWSIARLFILQQFFSPMVLLLPVYLPAMVDHGLSAVAISTLMCCLYVTTFLFEIPSGVWADQFSRRTVLMVADGICAFGFAVMALFPAIPGFAVGLICLALRATLYSGTHDAYLYDELAYHNATEHFGTVRSLTKIAQWAGVTLSSIGVWVYHEHGWAVVAWLSVLARMIGFAILWIMPEVGKVRHDVRPTFLQQVRDSLHVFRVHKRVLWIGVYTCSFAYLFMLYEYRTLLAIEWRLPAQAATLFVGGCSLAYCLGSVMAVRWRRDTWPAMLVTGCLAALCAAIGVLLPGGVFSAIFMILGFLIAEFWLIRTGVMQQHATPSHVRASTGSIVNFGASLLDIALAQYIGLMAGTPPRYLPVARTLCVAGLVMTVALLIVYVFIRPKNVADTLQP